jgi:hypothetical protein
MYAAKGAKILNVPVFYQGRTTGCTSLRGMKLLRSAFKSFCQTLHFRWRFPATGKS